MNKKIEELARKAGLEDQVTPFDEFDNLELQAFAELIIRECCDIFVELRTRPADLAVKDVKKHFGITKGE